ncbi:MAG: peptidase M23, partial [Sutterella wadsworthensis]
MKPFRLKFLCTACLAGALWLSPMHDGSDALAASAQQKAAQEKKRVEGQRANIEQKLQSLQAELDAREARSEEASQALKTADQAISQANRKLRDLREEKRGVEDELAKLRKSGNNVADNLKDAENTVAQIAKAQYINSRRSHWQNLIGGINPSTLASDKGKLEYLARTQQAAIDDLEERQSNIRNLSE